MSRTIEVDFLPQAFEETKLTPNAASSTPKPGIRDQLK
jgi:hypothetical protein